MRDVREMVLIRLLRLRPDIDGDIPLPRYMTSNSAGMDICAAIERDIILLPRSIELVPSGFALEIPGGFEAQIRPRSGLAINNGVCVLNSPGTIDSDYRGEVKVALINFGEESFTLSRGNRIAQMIISKVYRADFDIVDKLGSTDRGPNGFGHTGL